MTDAEKSCNERRFLLAGALVAIATLLLTLSPAGANLQRASNAASTVALSYILGQCGIPVFHYKSELIGPGAGYSVEGMLFPALLTVITCALWPASGRKLLIMLPVGVILALFLQLVRVSSAFLLAVHNPSLAVFVDGYVWPVAFAGLIFYGASRFLRQEHVVRPSEKNE